MQEKKRVIVTGSTGNLGKKAVDALKQDNSLEVICIGRNGGKDPTVITADLNVYDPSWAKHFEGADAVLHLAADPKPIATWESVQLLNVQMAFQVFRAAEEAKVRRFVFASSNWTMGGYRFSDVKLNASIAPRPINPYGSSKFFMEQYGLEISRRTKMSFISLRIGYCQPGENIPGPHMAFGIWGQQMWLGNKDWAQSVIKSVNSAYPGSAILNIMSNNKGMRWDMDLAANTIGYVPEEKHVPILSLKGRLKDFGARLREKFFPQASDSPVFGARW